MTCTTILRRITGPIGGAWTPYTAAQVAARRAAQMVAVVVCSSVPVSTTRPCNCAPPVVVIRIPGDLVPVAAGPSTPIARDVPEPSSALVLGGAVAGLWFARRRAA